MSSADDNFLTRWSRRKIGVAQPAATVSAPVPEAVSHSVAEEPQPPPLPSLDDVGEKGDIGAFFAKHVPEELRAAALRKAWLSDPAISGFIEMAENQWDFNTPGGAAAAGFGMLPEGFDVSALAESIMGNSAKPGAPPTGEPVIAPQHKDGSSLDFAVASDDGNRQDQQQAIELQANNQLDANPPAPGAEPGHVALQQIAVDIPRRHGRAMPLMRPSGSSEP